MYDVMKKYIQYLFTLMLLASACQPKFEMVPPGATSRPAKEFSENWYVTREGTGVKNGKDWNNSLSIQMFLSKITAPDATLSNSAFHIKEGVYQITSKDGFKTLTRDVGCIRGGYSASLEYGDLSACDPELYPTVFTGDVNANNVADDGDGAFLYLTGGSVRFDNITFRHFYLSNAASAAMAGKGSCVFGVNGFYQSTSLECRNCIFEGNVSAVNSETGREGGSCAFVTQGYFKASNCLFKGNKANSRGGVIRTLGTQAVLFMDRCLMTENQLTGGSFGSAIQCSMGVVCMNNCSLVGNSGYGSTLNGGGAFLVVNSTVIDDANPSDAENAAFRCESSEGANSTIINSVFSSSQSEGRGLILNNAVLTSKGYNLFKTVDLRGTSADPTKPGDTVKNSVLNGSVQGRTWMWDVNQVLSSLRGFAIVDDVFDAAVAFNPLEYSEIAVMGRSFATWVTAPSFAKDARGSIRGDDRFQPGSYDPNID